MCATVLAQSFIFRANSLQLAFPINILYESNKM